MAKYKLSLAANRTTPSKNGFKVQTSEKTFSTTRLNSKSPSSRREIKTSTSSSFNKENLITSMNSDLQTQIQTQSPVSWYSNLFLFLVKPHFNYFIL